MKKHLCTYWRWLENKDNRGRVIAIAAVASLLVAAVAAIVRSPTILAPPAPGGEVRLSLEDYKAGLEARAREVKKRSAHAHGEERTLLENELKEVKLQLSDVNAAYAEALSNIRELEASLDPLVGEIDEDQLAEIRAVLERGDFSRADALMADIEDQADTIVKRAAEAAFQRGKIAALQIRWDEAATHFYKAARLDPTYGHLKAAAEFAERAARYNTARHLFEELLDLSRMEHGDSSSETATVLNGLAGLLRVTGRYGEAERMYRKALEIGRETHGEKHRNYAAKLNNLADLLLTTGRYDEAEPLFWQALAISQDTIGVKHPDYAIRLNNLAHLLRVTGTV